MEERAIYQIVVLGVLGERWADWFPGMAIEPDLQNGLSITRLVGVVSDQSCLLGMLQTLQNLGLPLLSIQRAEWNSNI